MHKSISSPSKAFDFLYVVPWASSDLWGTVPSSTSVILALSQFWPCLRGNERHQELPYLPRDTVKMAGPRRVWINMCFSESYVQFALCHLNCSYYYFKWIHLSMWSLSLPPLITSTSQCSPRTRLLRAHSLKSALMFWIWRLAQNKFVWSN